jgi:ParB-like chromosome segregation protein Spo0J
MIVVASGGGGEYYVLDGNHRLDAIVLLGSVGKIPVRVKKG